jgi:D-alanyl-D-alanine carboxypeptidase/D-alanyl-D-alanine-endopeptidase (penicillin-binding protein 4)
VRIAAYLLLLTVAACAAPRSETRSPRPVQTNASSFAAVADSIINASDLNQTHWGIEVFDAARNRSLYSYEANRHFIPASNTKLVVTAVALGLLGPDFQYRTELLATGTPGDSAIDRLVLVGRGDPTWSARFHTGDFAVVEQLADSVALAGVRQIRQELIVDASYLGMERVHSAWEVGDLPYSYAAPVGSIAVAEAALRLIVTPGSSHGAPASVSVLGVSDAFPIRANLVTDSARRSANIDVDFLSWPDTIRLTGSAPLARPETTTIAVPDANRYAAAVFADALARRGISTGAARIVYDTVESQSLRAAAGRTLATWTSPPLPAIIAAIMQPSQNWIAETLVRTLGAHQLNRGTWAGGIEVERRYLIDVARLDSTSFSLRDASGLTAQNLLTPHAIVQLLEHARQASWGSLFRQGMPTPGLPRSTLSNRLAGLEGRVFAKTGTIANVNSLSGYIITRTGRELTFSIMTNSSGRPSAQVRQGIDRLVRVLAEWE